MYKYIKKLVTQIKYNQPLIINVTNYVTMDFIANGLLSLGASPMMTQSIQEINDLLKATNAVVINIGTLNEEFIFLCEKVCVEANRLGIPIVLDPVGAGASDYRTNTCLNLLERFNFSIIRGNASEVMALSNMHQNTKGVDTNISTHLAIKGAQILSSQYNVVIAISGKTDAVIDKNHSCLFDRGSPLMPKITGSGCLLSAVVGTFNAVHHDRFDATAAAVLFYSVCGELAAMHVNSPGSFKPHFLDALSFLPESHDYETN
jgi:hydroxyethylthiazole kinase